MGIKQKISRKSAAICQILKGKKKMYYYFAQVTSKRFLLPFVTVVGIVTLV